MGAVDLHIARLEGHSQRVGEIGEIPISGLALAGLGPKDFASFIGKETAKYQKIIQTANIRTD